MLQAPTASGKSLAFQLPMLNTLANDPRGHALMIYPTKALALDQRDQLHRLAKEIPGRKIESWFYDGDVDQETRGAIRAKPPAILLTNVDMLHKTFLGNADLWHGFLSNLRWVIVDEIHEYRGYFGSNVSMILRRFSHHLSQLGAHPSSFSAPRRRPTRSSMRSSSPDFRSPRSTPRPACGPVAGFGSSIPASPFTSTGRYSSCAPSTPAGLPRNWTVSPDLLPQPQVCRGMSSDGNATSRRADRRRHAGH